MSLGILIELFKNYFGCISAFINNSLSVMSKSTEPIGDNTSKTKKQTNKQNQQHEQNDKQKLEKKIEKKQKTKKPGI
jgi:ABC-type antimicrobial peptide transport system permease subunit